MVTFALRTQLNDALIESYPDSLKVHDNLNDLFEELVPN